MAIDLSTIPEPLRKRLIKLGEQYGSQDTLDQANQTLGAYAKHAKTLPGFSAKDAKRLEEARDALLEAGVGRDAVKGAKKATGKAYVEAVRQAQAARLSARALLASAHEDLEESSASGAREAEGKASAALALTRVGPTKAEPLAQQLAQLVAALKDPAVAAASEGAAEAVGALEAAIQALRQVDQADVARRGTQAETETLDLLDGVIVRLTRRARRAAGAAARLGGNPSLAQAFQLDKLYRSKGGTPPKDDDEGEGDDVDEGAELAELGEWPAPPRGRAEANGALLYLEPEPDNRAFRLALSYLSGVNGSFIAALQELPASANSTAKAQAQAITLTDQRVRCLGVVPSARAHGRVGLFSSADCSTLEFRTDIYNRFIMATVSTLRCPPLRVVGLHSHDRVTYPTEGERTLWGGTMKRQVDAFWSPGQPLVIMGDFNADPYDPEVSARTGLYAVRDRDEADRARPARLVANQAVRPLYNPVQLGITF
jgi:hypothetical protein